MQDLVGAYFRHGMNHVRVYATWLATDGNTYLAYVPLYGQSPATAEYVRGRCRRYLCEPHSAPEWIVDERIGRNPSLVQIWDVKEVSEKLFSWPRLSHRRTIEQTESHVLDSVAEELAADSQGV